MKTLKNRLKKKIESSYLIQGEDVVLYDRALELIKKACDLQLEEFNFLKYDDDNFNEDAFINSLETLPVCSEKKIVLLKNVTKTTQDLKNKLNSYLKNPTPSTCLVIFDFYNKFDFIISEKVDANRLDPQDLVEIIQREIAPKAISKNAAQLLVEQCAGYYSLISNELEKLRSISKDVVEEDDIKLMVNKETEFAVYELTEALSKKDAKRAVHLLDLMEKDTKTLGLIVNHFRRLFFVAISKDNDSTLARLLNVKEYAIVKARQNAKNFSKIQLKNIYELLNDVDFYTKYGEMQLENALYYLIFGILYC